MRWAHVGGLQNSSIYQNTQGIIFLPGNDCVLSIHFREFFSWVQFSPRCTRGTFWCLSSQFTFPEICDCRCRRSLSFIKESISVELLSWWESCWKRRDNIILKGEDKREESHAEEGHIHIGALWLIFIAVLAWGLFWCCHVLRLSCLEITRYVRCYRLL